MRLLSRGTLAALALMLALPLAPGCKKKDAKNKAGERAAEAKAAVPVPKALFGYVGVRDPGKTIDNALALSGKFFPSPYNRAALLDLLAQRAGLPRDLMAEVNVGGTFWLLMLDDKLVKGSNPGMAVFPIRSAKSFEAALAKRMNKGAKEGKLTVYEPKPGQVGLQKMALLIEDKRVFFPSNAKAFDACAGYFRAALQDKKPEHDVTLRAMVDLVARAQAEEIDKGAKKAKDSLKGMASKGQTADRESMAEATEQTIDKVVAWIKSTKEGTLGLDITPDKVLITAKAKALPGGTLAGVIKRQRPGKPVGLKLLPASSWLVFADRGNPESIKENQETWQPAMDRILADLDPERRAKLKAMIKALAGTANGDTTMAMHRAPGGPGLSLSVISGVTDTKKVQATLKELVTLARKWVKEEIAKKGKELPKGLEFKEQAFAHEGATGTLFSLSIPPELGKEKQAKMMADLAGDPMVMGWAFKDKLGFFVLGKNSEAQLKLLAEGKTEGKALADTPAFAQALGDDPGRVGLVYLSLVDLARWFSGTAVEKMMPPGLLDQLKEAKTAPAFAWGVNAARDSAKVTLDLPAEHFLAFKPLIDAALKMRKALSGGAGGMLGGSKWKDL